MVKNKQFYHSFFYAFSNLKSHQSFYIFELNLIQSVWRAIFGSFLMSNYTFLQVVLMSVYHIHNHAKFALFEGRFYR